MDNQNKPKRGPLKLDHKEIAVLFTLFAFSALLMFTLGIVVGKGITQAKYEGKLESHGNDSSTHNEHGTAHAEEHDAHASEQHANSHDTHAVQKPETESHTPLVLQPKEEKDAALTGGSLKEPEGKHHAESVLENPTVSALIDDSDSHTKKQAASPKKEIKIEAHGLDEKAPENSAPEPKRKTASQAPESFPSGKFTVKIGSYTSQDEAKQRVSELKNLGFEYAYFSAKNVGEKTWYGVWTGYYQDYSSARRSGEFLQRRDEVVSYLVRESSHE